MTVTLSPRERARATGLDPGLRRDDGEVDYRHESALALWAWVPAFAGMTVKLGAVTKALSRSDAPPPIPAIATFRPE